jgi:3D (Asp-Asp-Asp) domain-containing protein
MLKRGDKLKKVFMSVACTVMCMLLFSAVGFAAGKGDKPIQFGMRGANVLAVQKLLVGAGYYAGELDGVFGNITLNAVKEFQRVNGLPVNGVVGQDTLIFLRRFANNEPGRYSRTMVMSASAYSSQDSGNSSYTCRGDLLRKGIAAVDPNVIPLGTRLYIPGYGYAIADDIGGAIKGYSIDLAFDTHGEALQFGRRRVTVYVLE